MPTDGAGYAQTIANQSCSQSSEANEGTTSVQCTVRAVGVKVLLGLSWR